MMRERRNYQHCFFDVSFKVVHEHATWDTLELLHVLKLAGGCSYSIDVLFASYNDLAVFSALA